eukprot:2515885-Rhodomonas_salina.2
MPAPYCIQVSQTLAQYRMSETGIRCASTTCPILSYSIAVPYLGGSHTLCRHSTSESAIRYASIALRYASTGHRYASTGPGWRRERPRAGSLVAA